MRRRLAVLLGLVACGSPAPPPRAPQGVAPAATVAGAPPTFARGVRPPSAAELRVIDALKHETEQLRGLRFVAAVRVTIEDRAAMRAYVERAIDDAQLARARRRYLALGALDPALDVRALLVEIMEDELIGYYDPKEKRLAVRTDVAAALGSASGEASEQSLGFRATVVHELVHALQDQHFALDRALERKRTTDAENAFGALVEGDASLVMLGFVGSQAGASAHAVMRMPAHVRRMLGRPMSLRTAALARAPSLVREPLLFRYREGAVFAATLLREGGWAAVDAAHRAPPTSTRAIDAPSTYEAGGGAVLPVPSDGWLRAHDLRAVDDDVLGALETSLVLDEPALRDSWRADRYLVLESPRGDASLWWLQLSTPAAARRAATALMAGADPARKIARRGRALLVGRGLDAQQFQSAAAWTDTRPLPVRDRAIDAAIDLPPPKESTRQAPPFSNPRERARDAIAD